MAGLTPIFDDYDKEHPGVMHERRFRDCCPKNIKHMSKKKRQFCACKYHMDARQRHARLKQLRAQIKKEQQQQRHDQQQEKRKQAQGKQQKQARDKKQKQARECASSGARCDH